MLGEVLIIPQRKINYVFKYSKKPQNQSDSSVRPKDNIKMYHRHTRCNTEAWATPATNRVGFFKYGNKN